MPVDASTTISKIDLHQPEAADQWVRKKLGPLHTT